MDKIEIIIGTYDKLILGYRVVSSLNDSYSLEASFTDDSHIGSLRCVCVSPGGALASSSTDDSVRLHSLIKRKDIGQLFQHDGAVNCINFYKKSHMFTASDDGTISMWKTKNWEMMRSLKGHKTEVTAVAAHPSGKLGLSIGSDRSLFTWDFTTGKLAFRRKIKEAALNILFTQSGNHYILVYQKRIEVCSLLGTQVVQEINTSWRINAVCLVKGFIFAVAGDDRHVLLYNAETGQQVLSLDMAKPGEDTFSNRVRCLQSVVCEGKTLVIATTTSGNIKIFSVHLDENVAEVVLYYETKVRVTCMAAYNFAPGSFIEGEESELAEPKQNKTASKASTKSMGVKSVAEAGHDDEEEEAEEVEDLHSPNVRATARKRKRQEPPQKKARRMNTAEAERAESHSPVKQASASRAPKSPARQMKQLNKKKKKKTIT